MAIDGALPLVRVKLLRTVNNARVSPDTVTATPTVEHVTSNAHGYHDLRPVVSELDPDDPGVLYLDLPATDDADVNEQFAWRITFQGSERPTRLVSVPQTGAAVETIVNADGDEMPAVWLDALADFTGYSGPTAPPTITSGYVASALDVHEQAPDPHPGYALESAVATGLTGAVNTAAADASAKVEAHRTASDPHGDRAAASTALGTHTAANDPHGDRAAASAALTGHVQATDPHGDRSAAATALEQHRTASDPHGDRAAATTAIETHRTATDPHGDRAAAATALEGHRTASDPHGDRAAAASDAASKVETHRTASDSHGDRAWAAGQLAGKVDTSEADLAAGTASRRTLGTGGQQALPGNHASTTNSREWSRYTHGSGATAGQVPTWDDATSSYKPGTPTTAQVPDSSVTDAKVATGANIAEAKLALASDAAAATPSRRTLGAGAQQAAAGNHTHSGYAATSHTHPVTDISATGTRSASTYLRGDGAWATPSGGGGSFTPAHAGSRTGFYDPNRTLYAPSSAAFRALRGHVDRAAAGELVDMVCAGDSRTAGHAVGSQNAWASQLRALLTGAGVPSAGTGLVMAANGVGADSRITQTGSSWSQIPPYRQWAATGQTCTFVSDSPGTVVEVYYYGHSGAFTVKVDSATAVTVTPPGTGTVEKYTVPGLANTTHTVVVSSTSAAGYLIGFCVRQTTGLLVHPIAISGSTTTDWTNSTFPSRQGIVSKIAPSVFCLMLGAADALPSNNIPAATTAANYQTILATNNPNTAKMMIAESGPPDVSTATWAPYLAAMYDKADALGFPLLDLQDRWGGPDAGLAAGVLLSDKLHESTSGYSEIARAVTGMLAR